MGLICRVQAVKLAAREALSHLTCLLSLEKRQCFMVLLLIEFEIVHLREDNLFFVESHSEVLAHVEIPGIFK